MDGFVLRITCALLPVARWLYSCALRRARVPSGYTTLWLSCEPVLDRIRLAGSSSAELDIPNTSFLAESGPICSCHLQLPSAVGWGESQSISGGP